MNNDNGNKKGNKFSSAMGDLKGLLDKEGIDLNADSKKDNDIPVTYLPVDKTNPEDEILDDYISDFDEDLEDQLELIEFAESVKELEETVQSITETEHLQAFEQNVKKTPQPVESPKVQSISQFEELKTQLKNNLSLQIETSINELKTKLLKSMEQEVNKLFDNSQNK